MKYYIYTRKKSFVEFIRHNKIGFTINGELYIYLGGASTSWKRLLPIFKDVIIQKYNKSN